MPVGMLAVEETVAVKSRGLVRTTELELLLLRVMAAVSWPTLQGDNSCGPREGIVAVPTIGNANGVASGREAYRE